MEKQTIEGDKIKELLQLISSIEQKRKIEQVEKEEITEKTEGKKLGPYILAEKIGVNFQTVGYLEREEYNPSLDLAFRISEYFGLPINLIFSTQPLKPMSQELFEQQKRRGE